MTGDMKNRMNKISRKQAKEACGVLVGSQNALKLIITNIPQIVFWKDTKSVFMGCNKAFTQVSGISEQDIICKTDFDLLPKEQAEHMQLIDKEVLSGKVSQHTSTEKITRHDGTSLWIDLTLVPLYDQKGSIKGVLGTAENITEKISLADKLKHSEEKYKNLIEFTNTGYIIMDDKLNILEANQTFANTVGTDFTQVIGKNPRAWVDNSDVHKFDHAFGGILSSSTKLINDLNIDFYNIPDKRAIATSITANLIENGSKKIFCLVRDVSERKVEEQRKYIADQKSRDRIRQNINELRDHLKNMRFK